MKEILLTKGMVTIVDDDDYAKLSSFSWRIQESGTTSYAARTDPDNNKTILMHRAILNVTASDCLVDHENCDGLDNRKSNLRLCTKAQNKYNCRKYGVASSQFKGVSFVSKLNKWQAQIQRDRKNIYLGIFNIEKDAALSYDKKAKELFGEFAKLNFPQP